MAGSDPVFILCPPGPLAIWIFRILEVAAARAGYALQYVDRTDPIPEDTPAAIYASQYPSPSAIALTAAGRLDAIVIACDPKWSVSFLMASGNSLLEAIRLLTGHMTANVAIGTTSRSRLVYPAFDQPAGVTARSLLAHCGLPTDPATVAEVLAAIQAPLEPSAPLIDVVTQIAPEVAQAPVLTMEQSAIVDNTLAGLAAMALGDFKTPIIWPTEVYFFGDVPNTPIPAIAPVTGPSRVMAYGPYLHLPPARYAVELIIAFSGRIEEIPFLLEFHALDQCLARYRLEGRRSGAYRSRFYLTVVDPVAPIEVRLRNERGAIEGEVSLGELRFLVAPADGASRAAADGHFH